MSLARQAFRGILFAYGAFGLEKLSALVVTVVLARVLPPSEFSLVPTLMLFLFVADSLRDFGIKDALVYVDDRRGDYAATGFALILTAGLVQTMVGVGSAPLVADWLSDPRLGPLFQVLSLSFLFNALGNTQDALLQKNLHFERLYSVNLSTAVVKTAVVLGGIAGGLGVWSVVLGQIVGAALRTALRWWQSPWRPTLGFQPRAAARLLRYGIHPTVIAFAGPLLGRADQLAIITLIGTDALGTYYLAARVPELLITNISSVLSGVLFPMFASMQSDRARLTRSFLFSLKALVSVTAPIALGTMVVAPELIVVLFGQHWQAAVPVLRYLAVAGLLMSIPWVSGDIYKAVGRPDLLTKLIAIESTYSLALIWGLTAARPSLTVTALAVCVSQFLSAVLRLTVASRVVGFAAWQYARAIAGPIAAAALMAAIVEGWRRLAAVPAPLPMLVTAIVIGAGAYAGLYALLERETLRSLIELLRARLAASSDNAQAARQ